MSVAAAGVAHGATSAPHPLTGFHTPSWAAQCVVTQLAAQNSTTLTCWTPNDGFTVRMNNFGRASKSYIPKHRGYRDTYWAKGVLSFGEDWGHVSPGLAQYGCQSRRTGLTCGNHDGHGWWIGRYRGYRIW